jgi:hypothetical protein
MALNIRERVRQLAGRGGDTDTDGEIDQLEARKERARQEARQEAAAEARQAEVDEAREQAFKERRSEAFGEDDSGPGALSRVASAVGNAVDAVDDGDNEFMDDFETAMQTDFDGDGDPFAAELGLQSDRESEQVEQVTGALANQVNENTAGIDMLQQQVEPTGGRGGGAGGVFADDGGSGFTDADAGVFATEDKSSEATDQADDFWGL